MTTKEQEPNKALTIPAIDATKIHADAMQVRNYEFRNPSTCRPGMSRLLSYSLYNRIPKPATQIPNSIQKIIIMAQEKKISDEKLLEELEKGKTLREIEQEHGYHGSGGTLARRLNNLGYEENSQVSTNEYGGANFYVTGEAVKEAFEKAGVDQSETIYYSYEVNDEGEIVITPTEKKWVKLHD